MGFHSPLRKSRLAPPSSVETSLPPTSFSRTGGSTFRESLRKIPSTIFMRNDQKKEMVRKKSMDRLGMGMGTGSYGATALASATLTSVPAFTKGEKEKEKPVKAKTKTRKALGELFGWGNSSHTPAPAVSVSVPSAPSPLRPRAPAVPSKLPTPPTKDNIILRKPPLSVLSRKTSTNTFGTITSAHTSATTAALRAPEPISLGRTSIGDDPFGRTDHGVEVVERIPKRDVTSPSIKSDFSPERRRDSMCSGKALSAKTVASDEVSIHETAMRARISSPRRITMASVIEEKKRLSGSPGRSRPVSSTAPTLNPLVVPPPRLESLNYTVVPAPMNPVSRVRITNDPRVPLACQPAPPPPLPPAPAPAPALITLPTPFDRKASRPAMRKDKTKSKVWGFLGKINGKSKEEKENEPPKQDAVEHASISRPLLLGNKIQTLHHRPSRHAFSVERAPAPAPTRSAVPVFHISHPSVDTSSGGCNDSPSPMPRSLQSDHAPSQSALLVEVAANKRDSGSTIASLTDLLAKGEEGDSTGAFQCAQLLGGPKPLPKRKSLEGLFGVSIKRSSSDLQAQAAPLSAKSFATEQSAFDWTPPKLRPLSEEMDEVSFGAVNRLEPVPFHEIHIAKRDPGLRRVASATDKLINLVSSCSFSPSPSPAKARLAAMPSFNSLRAQTKMSGSPTPIRKVQSAMLFNKSTSTPSPIKPASNNVSPLKYVLQKAHVRKLEGVSIFGDKPVSRPKGEAPDQEDEASPVSTSLVKKGMRNPFAPPSPERLMVQQTAKLSRPPASATLGPMLGLAGDMDEETSGDVGGLPADLQAIFKGFGEPQADLAALGLPVLSKKAPIPPHLTRLAPHISLPPVPLPNVSPAPLALDQARPVLAVASASHQVAEDQYDTPDGGNRDSFDFTSEYEELDRGTHRDSFMAALHRVGSSDMLRPALAPLPLLPPHSLYTIEQSPDSARTARGSHSPSEVFADALDTSRRYSPAKARKVPFQGTVAFQQHVSQNKGGLALTPSPPIEPEVHAPPPSRYQRNHTRNDSTMTTSSLGDVIDTSESPREYTNFFEVNFAQHLAKQTAGDSVDLSAPHSRSSSVQSTASILAQHRAPTRRNHHRRNSSIISVESIGINANVGGPPRAELNKQKRRSGYISKHRRDMSSDSAWGRSDWASHRRNFSAESTSSATSIARIGRPGLGDRMFQLDGGVRLSPITASPPDHHAHTATHSKNSSWASLGDIGEVSYDTIFDGPSLSISPDSLYDGHARTVSIDSLFDDLQARRDASEFSTNVNRYSSGSEFTNKRSSASGESIFGAEADTEEAEIKQGFFLRGIRPMSAVSSGMSSEAGEDTFIDVKRYVVRRAVTEEVLEGRGEERMTPIQESLGKGIGSISLSGSISRPAKPKSARRRPAHLIFDAHDPETPGLTSPSTSETSSRISLETRFSSDAGVYAIGHRRQKSSAHVKPQATIKEEASMSTLRAPTPYLRPRLSRENLRRQDARDLESDDEVGEDADSTESITAWLRLQREATDVCRQTKDEFRDSADSLAAVQGTTVRFSPQSVADFLAKSAATYKPLTAPVPIPPPRVQAHRRKSSLADARALSSPYGLPPPKPAATGKPRGSLTTKFERSNSANSTRGSEDGVGAGTVSTPQSGLFAHLMSDLVPSPVSSAHSPFAAFLPQRQSSSPPASARTAGKDVFNLAGTVVQRGKASDPPIKAFYPLVERPENGQADPRTRVDSGERRKALGWGRRRNSDGPAQVVQQSKVVSLGTGHPATYRGPTRVYQGDENVMTPAVKLNKPSQRPQGKASSRKIVAVRPPLRGTANAGRSLRV